MEHNIELEIIVALLKYKGMHVRKIGKTLNIPNASVSRATRKLVEKKVLDFRIEGKNKIFALKPGIESQSYIFMAEHYKLQKLISKYPSLSVIIDSINEKNNNDLVLIFGSYAKFKAKNNSDIDIYIKTKDRNIKKKIEQLNSKINVKIGEFDKNNLLIKEIIKDHIIIKGVERYYEIQKVFE